MTAVLGLDLSISATGIAFATGGCDTIKTTADVGDARLALIRNRVRHEAQWADLVVMENFVVRSPAAASLGMVHGAVRVALLDLGKPYALVPPASLKRYATGRGNAVKADMRMALYKRTGLDVVDDNQVDALWLRAMGMDHLGHPYVDLPVLQRSALDVIAWPDLAAA